jgi:hypothetical protein
LRRAQREATARVQNVFTTYDLTPAQRWYLDFNAPRYGFLLSLLHALYDGVPRATPLRVLDVGPSFQTALVRRELPRSVVDTLGFEDPLIPLRESERHLTFDLNDAIHPDLWPRADPYDVVLMCEVIEHLYTSPTQVLAAVRSLMTDGSHLILQTPNACALHKRLQMLAGRHPFGPIAEDRTKPLHFREYLVSELCDAGMKAGLAARGWYMDNYFERDSAASKAYNEVARLLPGSLRTGITVVFEAR